MSFFNKFSTRDRVGLVASRLKEGKILRFIEAHNGIGGLIIDELKVGNLEFDGFWESSLTDSASKGLPDIEIVSFDSRLETINQIMEVTQKPMIVDGDTGGDFNQFEYLVQRLEKAGVSMVVIEDKVFPKRNSLESGAKQELENPEIFAEKIRRGQMAKSNQDFLIVARVESLIAGLGQRDALERAETYLRAGADGILIHSKKETPDEVLEFAAKFKELPAELIKGKILACVPTTYNTINEEELEKAGFNLVVHANHLLRASYAAMEKVAKEILIRGRSFEVNPDCASVEAIFSKVGFLAVKEKDKETAEKFGAKIRVLIPAAGRDQLSEEHLCPKALLDIDGKNILQRQMEIFKSAGLTNIAVVKGYKGELFNVENVCYYDNPNYDKEHVLSSMFCAEDYLDHPFVFTFSDILFNESIVRNLLKTAKIARSADIVLVVDDAFQYHKHRIDKELDIVITKNKVQDGVRKITDSLEEEVVAVGKKIDKNSADYEFIGVAYFSQAGAKILKDVFRDCLEKYNDKPFHEAQSIHQAGFTDIIQEIIDRGHKVNVLKTYKGWMEIHNEHDLDLAKELYRNA